MSRTQKPWLGDVCVVEVFPIPFRCSYKHLVLSLGLARVSMCVLRIDHNSVRLGNGGEKFLSENVSVRCGRSLSVLPGASSPVPVSPNRCLSFLSISSWGSSALQLNFGDPRHRLVSLGVSVGVVVSLVSGVSRWGGMSVKRASDSSSVES